jgi:hypothetical protein
MTTTALSANIGSPDTVGILPISTFNLSSQITTSQTAASTADTAMGTLQTEIITANTSVATALTDFALIYVDIDLMSNQITAGGAGGPSYVGTSHMWSGTSSSGFTLNATNASAFLADWNTLVTQVNLAKTDTTTAQTNTTTAVAQAVVTKADTAAALTAANAVVPPSTSDMTVVYTSTNVGTSASKLNGLLAAVLAFARNAGLVS